MNRKIVILATTTLAALTLGVQQAWTWRQQQVAGRLKQLEGELASPRAVERAEAAAELLRHDPSREDWKLAHAEALIRSGRYNAAKEELTTLTQPGAANPMPALLLTAEALLASAADQLALVVPESVDLSVEPIERLLQEVDGIRQIVQAQPQAKQQSAMLEARLLHTRAMLLRLQVADQRNRMNDARAIDVAEQVRDAGSNLHRLQDQLSAIDQRLIELCSLAAGDPAQASLARQLLIETLLRGGRQERARSVASQLVAQKDVLREVAGQVAVRLLSLEQFDRLETTDSEVELAQRLLEHASLKGEDPLQSHSMGRVLLMLRQGKAKEAEVLAREMQGKLDSPPRVTALLAHSLIAQGRFAEATDLLLPLNDRVTSPQVKAALGAALLAQGRASQAIEMYRRALELRSDDLSVHLQLCEALASRDILAAESEISAAARLAPAHTRVMSLQARLAVEQPESAALVELLNKRSPQVALAQDALLASALAMDDGTAIAQWSQRWTQQKPGDILGHLAGAVLSAAPQRRALVEAIIVEQLSQQHDADPLSHGEPPVNFPTGPAPASAGREADLLRLPRLLPLPEESALEVVRAAMASSQDDPALLLAAAELAMLLDDRALLRQCVAELIRLAPDPAWHKVLAAYVQDDPAAGAMLASLMKDSPSPSPAMRGLALILAAKRSQAPDIEAAIESLHRLHPWSELPLLQALSVPLQTGRPEQTDWMLDRVARINPALTQAARAKVNLAARKPIEAINELDAAVAGENAVAGLRLRLVDQRALAELAAGRVELAVGALESIAQAAHWNKPRLQLAAADLLVLANRPQAASATLAVILTESSPSARLLDQILARCQRLMQPARLMRILDGLLALAPGDDVLLVWKAQLQATQNDSEGALLTLAKLLQSRPSAARAMLLQARVLRSTGKKEEADEVLRRMIQLGADVPAARRELALRSSAASTPDAPSRFPGSQ